MAERFLAGEAAGQGEEAPAAMGVLDFCGAGKYSGMEEQGFL